MLFLNTHPIFLIFFHILSYFICITPLFLNHILDFIYFFNANKENEQTLFADSETLLFFYRRTHQQYHRSCSNRPPPLHGKPGMGGFISYLHSNAGSFPNNDFLKSTAITLYSGVSVYSSPTLLVRKLIPASGK
jgi:hypothetical protein